MPCKELTEFFHDCGHYIITSICKEKDEFGQPKIVCDRICGITSTEIKYHKGDCNYCNALPERLYIPNSRRSDPGVDILPSRSISYRRNHFRAWIKNNRELSRDLDVAYQSVQESQVRAARAAWEEELEAHNQSWEENQLPLEERRYFYTPGKPQEPCRLFRLLEEVDDSDCGVCRETLKDAESLEESTARRLPCGHKFHYTCVFKWITEDWPTKRSTCPMCRQRYQVYQVPNFHLRQEVPELWETLVEE